MRPELPAEVAALLAEPWPHRSPPPEVRLLAAFELPYEGAVAAARTCYSPRGVVTPEEVATDPTRTHELSRDLYRAGHHTVFQHAHFTFAIANVTRQLVWSFLHAHPFYNSEQVSQRYVRVRPGTAFLPELGAHTEAYAAVLAEAHEDYRRLDEALRPIVAEAYFARFPARARAAERWRTAIARRSREIARYLLPIGTFTYLHHTISGLTLLRYLRLADHPDTPSEQRWLVARMVAAVLEHAPGYAAILEPPLPRERQPAWRYTEPTDTAPSPGDEVEAELVAYDPEAEARVTRALAEVTGRSWTVAEAAALLDPVHDPLLGESLNLAYHDKLLRVFQHVHYVFRKRLSHAADSQDQRHRLTPGSRPILTAHLRPDPDVVVPRLVRLDPGLRRLYEELVARRWQRIDALRRRGVAAEWLQYLLPNAVAIRFTESADLLALRHKHLMRLCYNAQEEIWHASVAEAAAVRRVHPHFGRWLVPPCTARDRAGTRPVCPEGSRFCGVPVWRLPESAWERTI